MCGFRYVLLVDFNYISTGNIDWKYRLEISTGNIDVFRLEIFFILRLLFIDDAVVASDSEKTVWLSTGFILMCICL